MSRLEKILAVIAAVLAIGVGVLWLYTQPRGVTPVSADFSDTQALIKSDLARSGLIPPWLPVAATDLKLRRDADGTLLFFRFPDEDLAALREACPRILQPTPVIPERIGSEMKPSTPDAFYLCQGSTLAIDGAQRSALLWNSP
jgi:hypothetical protein